MKWFFAVMMCALLAFTACTRENVAGGAIEPTRQAVTYTCDAVLRVPLNGQALNTTVGGYLFPISATAGPMQNTAYLAMNGRPVATRPTGTTSVGQYVVAQEDMGFNWPPWGIHLRSIDTTSKPAVAIVCVDNQFPN